MTDLGLFAKPGALFRCPGGNIEVIPAQQQTIAWSALNIGRDPCVAQNPEQWAPYRKLADGHLEVFPWMHCRSYEDIEFLFSIGHRWRSVAVGLNIEDVVGDALNLELISKMIANQWGKQVLIPTLPWVQNGQGWHHLKSWIVALEIFPDENAASTKPQDCIDHAFAEGLEKVTLMFKTKSHAPADYDLAICHSFYTGDDIGSTMADWARWDTAVTCHPAAPTGGPPMPPKPKPPLTEKKFPNTAPRYGPSHPDGPTLNSPTVKGIKRGMIRMGYLNQQLGSETDDFGATLEEALKAYQRHAGVQATGQYGRTTWTLLRSATVPAEFLHAGEYAMDAKAQSLVREDAFVMCYPHPLGALSEICQGLHPTAGVSGNWAMDFCAPGGTKVVAVERAVITKLSGHDPAEGANQTIGIFGWSIYYETPDGYTYFSTHYGSRASLRIGQVVEVGQVVGTVGHWPGEPSRSHTHLGVSSVKGIAAAKKRITEISQAQRVAA